MGPLGHSAAALAALVGAVPGAVALAVRPSWRVGLRERLGASFGRAAPAPGAVWIHAASVGEVLAASRLLERLQELGHPVCATAQTPAGRELLRSGSGGIPSALAPLDHPWCVAAALDRVAPALLVLVENELWPFWIRAASERGVPVVSVSARLSQRSLRTWQRAGALSQGVARRLRAVGARTEADAERFVQLGVPGDRVSVTGDLKLEPRRVPPLAPDLAMALGDIPLVVAASTHEGEEEAALSAFAAVAQRGALIVAPRHANRFDAVAAAAGRAGRPLRRRSALGGAALGDGEVLILDSVGELAGVFARACLAFVGGSLVDRGGHNVLEPVQAGCPAVMGPHAANVEHALRLLEPTGAVGRIGDAEDLAAAFAAALADPAEARHRGEAGRLALEPARGATERTAQLLETVLETGEGA